MLSPFISPEIMTVIQFKLNTGGTMPSIGIGASPAKVPEGRDTSRWLLTALKSGYRHIDTASIYGTEEAVADAIEQSGIPREDIFLTTKLNWINHGCIPESITESLSKLRTSYIDLFLLHWPQCAVSEDGNNLPKNSDGTYKLTTKYNFRQSWKRLEDAYRSGKCKAIGVSNFSVKTLEELMSSAEITPAVNQVEMHPYLSQNALLEYCKAKGILVVAYTPGGRDVVRNDPTIRAIASSYAATPTQVIMSWHIGRGVAVLPKSINESRQKENLVTLDLTASDTRGIDGLDRVRRISNGCDNNGQVFGWTYEQLGW